MDILYESYEMHQYTRTKIKGYVAGMSVDIKSVCRKFNIRVVFRSGRTKGRVKDKLSTSIACTRALFIISLATVGGKYYIGETIRRLETRMREHQDACRKCAKEKTIAEHACQEPELESSTTIIAMFPPPSPHFSTVITLVISVHVLKGFFVLCCYPVMCITCDRMWSHTPCDG